MSKRLQIGMFGAGRLGQAIQQHLGDQLAWQVTRNEPPHAKVDAIIEASTGSQVAARLAWALTNNVPLIIGSTGWDLPDLVERVGNRIGVVTAPNFSLGVALLRRMSLVLARFAARDEQLYPYLVEHHQARKHDAPSGTAKLLATTILAGCPRKQSWRIGGPIDSHELSVAVMRAGHTYSEHRVGIDAPAEVLELRHTARSPMAFADGALTAATWIQGKTGVFTMDDVAQSVLDPLFTGLAGGER